MQEYIKIKCTDNNKWVEGKVIDHKDGWINVLIQPGDIRCNLKRTKPDVYVGSVSGYEFVYQT